MRTGVKVASATEVYCTPLNNAVSEGLDRTQRDKKLHNNCSKSNFSMPTTINNVCKLHKLRFLKSVVVY